MLTSEVMVVGAGISGLAFAHHCATQRLSVAVFEKDAHAGGCIKSQVLPAGPPVELGGHTLTNSYRSIIALLEARGKLAEVVARPALSFELATPTGLTSIARRLRLGELLRALPRALWTRKAGQSVRAYHAAIVGRENYARVLHHAFQAVLCQDPDDFPAEFLFRRRRRDPRLPRRFSLPGGVAGVLAALLEDPRITLHRRCPITAVTRTAGGQRWQAFCGERLVGEAGRLALACPPDQAARLLHPIEPALARLLATLGTTSIDSVLLEGLDHPGHGALARRRRSLIGVDQPFLSALYQPVGERKLWVFHFAGAPRTSAERATLGARALGLAPDGVRVLAETRSQLPTLHMRDLPTLAAIRAAIAGTNLFLPTNYFEGLSMDDCCRRAEQEAQRLAAKA